MSSVDSFDVKNDIVDEPVPRHTNLAARYKQSFAYYTFQERLPASLRTLVENLLKDKDEIVSAYGAKSQEELDEVIENIKELKTDVENNNKLQLLEGEEPDTEVWNTFLNQLPKKKRNYYHTCWLYAECYMYRKISSFFKNTSTLKTFDYFGKQKENAMNISENVILAIAKDTRSVRKSEAMLVQLLKLNLWGNRCDLSITSGGEVKPMGNPLDNLEHLNNNIVIDNSGDVWRTLNVRDAEENIIDIICDNAGFEFFTDLILAEYLIDKGLACKVRFHVKAIPWYISDVTPRDFHWAIHYLKDHEKFDLLRSLGNKYSQYIFEGKFELAPEEFFWTSPYEYYRMSSIRPDLHETLAKAHLLIFKGDLNYRKLLGDFKWDYTEDFNTCLRGFRPTNLCSLRTVKGDLICGLTAQQVSDLNANNSDWMFTGEFGVIQFAPANTTYGEEESL